MARTRKPHPPFYRFNSSPEAIVTDRLCSCGAAKKQIGNKDRQDGGRWQYNRAENAH